MLTLCKNSCSKSTYHRFLFALLLFIIIVRLPFAWIAYQAGDIGTFLLHGMSIAKDGAVYGTDFYNGRGPGGFYLYAVLLKLFGYKSTLWINLVGVLWHTILTLLVVLIAKKLWDKRVALYAGLFYSVFSFAHILTDSLPFNVEPMALLPLLVSIYFFVSGYEKDHIGNLVITFGKLTIIKFFFSGLFLGLTFSIRQSMAVVLLFICILQFLQTKKDDSLKTIIMPGLGRILVIFLGFLLGSAIGYVHPIVSGRLYGALYCSVIYGFKFPVVSWSSRFISFIGRFLIFVLYQPLLWVGVLLILIKHTRMVLISRGHSFFNPAVFILMIFLFECLGLFVMGRVVGHCFFALFPFAALILANEFAETWFFSSVQLGLKKLVLSIGCVVPIAHFLLFPAGVIVRGFTISDYLVEMLDENTAAFRAAQYIKDNTDLDSRIYCLTKTHANDRFYFMTQRLPATVPLDVDFRMDVGEFLEKAGHNALIVVFSASLGGIQEIEGQDIRSFLIDRDYKLAEHFEDKKNTKFYYGKTFERRPEWIEIWKIGKLRRE